MSLITSFLRVKLDHGESYELLESVKREAGYNRDVEVDKEFFEDCDRLERSSRTYVDKIVKGAKVYRDDKPTTSLHVTDFRDSEREGIGAHLEFFNPEYHPFLHIIDVILWNVKYFLEGYEEKLIQRNKIGEGLQYNVFEVSNEKVIKFPKSREEMIQYCLENGSNKTSAENSTKKGFNRRKKVVKELKQRNHDLSIFGNPEFLDGDIVLQDRVNVVEEIFEQAELSERKKVIDQYIELSKKLWEYGMADTIFNFTVNTGLDSDDKQIMLDFGEIIFSKERVRTEIKNEKWLEKWSYDQLDSDLQDYFKKRMREELTVEELEDKWREKC